MAKIDWPDYIEDLLDELENFDDASAVSDPRGAAVACSVVGCKQEASFIVHKAAYCAEHRKLVAS